MFNLNGKVDIALNRDVEMLLKSGEDGVLPIVQAGEPVLRVKCEA